MHNLWLSAVRPASEELNNIRCSCNAKYKLAIRDAYDSLEDRLSDDMYKHFVNKNQSEFWKSWNSKFRENVSKHVTINGKTEDADVANE